MKICLIALAISMMGQAAGLAQKPPGEPSLLLGYQRYFRDVLGPVGFANLGYTRFFEHGSLYRFNRYSRFAASALINPVRSLYGLQISGSYSYIITGGVHVNVIRQVPFIVRTWQGNIEPFLGIDIWFLSFHIGYNLQVELHPPLTPPPPAIGRISYTLNAYWPLKRNKSMYR
ncbi:MAG: hypothetical protein HYZ16_00460 [Bacteroidetes bacterium]|nr:hypothetical protein [Bacteroidota bacterium]